MPTEIQVYVNIIGALAIIYFGWRELRNKNAAGDVSVSSSWAVYVKELQSQNAAIKTENAELKGRLDDMESMIDGMGVTIDKQERKIQTLSAQVVLLETQLRARNIVPIQFEERNDAKD